MMKWICGWKNDVQEKARYDAQMDVSESWNG